MQLPSVHLAIMQPAGYLHSQGFLDQARYFRHQFRRMGATVTIAKNRLREDAINFVFGAHLGFPPDWQGRHACVFVNLEQLGRGGAVFPSAYLKLLRHSAVVDYDVANVAAYGQDPADVPLVPFLYAPYLANTLASGLNDGQTIALEDRPIDLLFYGSMNPRRQAYIAQIETTGVQVATFDHALYGPERDQFICQAKAVLNCHFYDSSRFEQARVFHCLSLGTPVISERSAATLAPPQFDDAVFWLEDGGITPFFAESFGRPAYFDAARTKLAEFRRHDPIDAYADLLAFASGFHKSWRAAHPTDDAWRPTSINLGSGKDYKPGWLNLDILDRAEPDLVLDLGQPLSLPLHREKRGGGAVLLEAGSVELVYANNVLEHVPDLPTLMGNVLSLLRDGGEFRVEVPYEKAASAWQDPTHLRALNEKSWLYYTEWFWYLGWFDHRFEITEFFWLDEKLKDCEKADAAFMKLTLRKVVTSPQERTVARSMRSDFGGVDEDWLDEDLAAAHC